MTGLLRRHRIGMEGCGMRITSEFITCVLPAVTIIECLSLVETSRTLFRLEVPSVLQIQGRLTTNATYDVNQPNLGSEHMVWGRGTQRWGAASPERRTNKCFPHGRLVGDTLGNLRVVRAARHFRGILQDRAPITHLAIPEDRQCWGDYSFTSLDPRDVMSILDHPGVLHGTNTYAATSG
jgi:hypothetical protein